MLPSIVLNCHCPSSPSHAATTRLNSWAASTDTISASPSIHHWPLAMACCHSCWISSHSHSMADLMKEKVGEYGEPDGAPVPGVGQPLLLSLLWALLISCLKVLGRVPYILRHLPPLYEVRGGRGIHCLGLTPPLLALCLEGLWDVQSAEDQGGSPGSAASWGQLPEPVNDVQPNCRVENCRQGRAGEICEGPMIQEPPPMPPRDTPPKLTPAGMGRAGCQRCIGFCLSDIHSLITGGICHKHRAGGL